MQACPTCDREFSSLGAHFQWNPDHRPELSNRQRSIVEYLILRGANVRREGPHPRLEVFSTESRRLTLVADALGWLANSPRCHLEATDPNSSDMWAFTTVAHPELDYDGPTDVGDLRPFTARLMVVERATFVGTLFGSLHVDLRGWDLSGDHLQSLFTRMGVATAEYEGEGYATDTHTTRYHSHDDVVTVPHYEAVDLLEAIGLSVSDVAEPIELG